MCKKVLFLVFFITLSAIFSKSYAKTVEVESLSAFSTDNPPQEISVKLSEPLELSSDLTLEAGVILEGDLVDVVSPKRLKRNASFAFKPLSYIDLDGKTYDVPDGFVGSYTTLVDKKAVAKNAALGVGNYFVKGLSVGAAAVEGAVHNAEDNRFKSSAVAVYEASPLSLVQKGKDLEINKSDVFYLKFRNTNSKDKKEKEDSQGQNFEYTIEKE